MKQIAAVLALLSALGARPLFACAPAPRDGDSVTVVAEGAVIVWDPATKTEHFIRRASFRGEGRDFGFLVPTPTAPALAEVDDAIFTELEAVTRPKTVYVTRKTVDWTPLLVRRYEKGNSETMVGAAPESVQVLSTQKVAGYDAAVLDASDAEALRKWLDEHGYATTPDLVEWLDAYVRQGWKITAFKVAADRPDSQTSAVKMTFQTDRPFFPYREPASQRNDPKAMNVRRYLHIWFLGSERVSGTVGSGPWSFALRRSEALGDPLRQAVARMAGVSLPATVRMTAFEDSTSPRPGIDDLFFAASADQAEVIPPPNVIERVEAARIPLDVVALAAAIIGFFIVRRARRRRVSGEY